jgi:hypothetical protein
MFDLSCRTQEKPISAEGKAAALVPSAGVHPDL